MKGRPKLVSPEWRALKPKIDSSLEELDKILGRVKKEFPEASKFVRPKTYKSAREKRDRKTYSSYQQMPDLIKGVFQTDSFDEAITAVQLLLNQTEVVKWELKKGSVENPYKGVYHLDVRSKTGLTMEVMVTTKEIWQVKRKSNRFYKTGRAAEASFLWEKVQIPV